MNFKIFTRRIYITGLLIVGIACFFIVRLATLHFTDKIKLENSDTRTIRRGEIRDKEGYLLAISVERESLFANPEAIADPEKTATALARVLNLDRKQLREHLARKKRFVWIKRRLDGREIETVKALAIKGLHLRKEYQRVYPYGSLASNIIGFVGTDNQGLEGIEYKYDSVLNGRKWAGDQTDLDVLRGHHVRLTIDRFIQHVAQREIAVTVEETRARQGIVVVYEIKTGRLLALARAPGFDPNRYWEYNAEARKNFSVVSAFEPGSMLKVIAAVSLLESVPTSLNDRYTCKGKIEIADTTINCTDVHGEVDLDKTIAHSCNVGMIEAMRRVRKDRFHDVLKRFGFGGTTGIDLPGESTGILRDVEEWSGLSKYSISLGQEIAVTSIQMVAAFAALANHGIYMVPAVIESFEKSDGTVLQRFYPRTRGRVVNEKIAGRILRMMKGVVDTGTGKKARTYYYEVAGKTGTAQKSMPRGGYYSDKYYASFIGIAPYSDPDICVLVMLDEPVRGTSGSMVAAPVFSRVVRRVLPYRGVKSETMPANEPLTARRISEKVSYTRVPDLRGKRLHEALNILTAIQQKVPVSYRVYGTGTVFRQIPEPGIDMERNQKIILYLRERQ